MYLDYDRDDSEIKRDGDRFWRFDFLTNAGEQSDDTKSFMYCDGSGRIHVTCQVFSTNTIWSGSCSASGFIDAVKSLNEWLDAIYVSKRETDLQESLRQSRGDATP